MSKILMLRGLPASGKSTYAKELVARGGWKRINKDDLRAMLDNSKWSKANEKFVLRQRDLLVTEALNAQLSVVVDDTNFNPIHEKALRDIADEFKIPFEVKFIDTPLEECLERNIRRPAPVREKVIVDMYNQYLKPKPLPAPVWDANLPTAIICDIDGTLAHGIGDTRKPYEWDKVDTDTVDTNVAHILETFWAHYGNNSELGVKLEIILVSGRDGSCREKTMNWLFTNHIRFNYLFMRKEGDNRNDAIVKEEIYLDKIAGKYNVLFVLDDRDRVVAKWRSLGLQCLQVADGNF